MGIAEPSDIELLQRIQQDDAQAFETLFRRMWEPLFLFAYKRLKSSSDAEDVVQQVFMSIWERRKTARITTSFSNYLFTAVRYEVIDQLTLMSKTPGKIEYVEEHILPAFNETAAQLMAKELDSEISEYIDSMPRQMQNIFRLSREEQLTPREIAERLKISEKTVRNQLSIAVNHLRPLVKESLLLLVLFHS